MVSGPLSVFPLSFYTLMLLGCPMSFLGENVSSALGDRTSSTAAAGGKSVPSK